jgi:hypothetical protein
VLAVAYVLCTEIFRAQWINPYQLDLSFRLHHRAVRLAMTSVLQRAQFSLTTGTMLKPDELFLTLHRLLSASWMSRMENQVFFRRLIVWSSAIDLIVVAVINVVSSRICNLGLAGTDQ